VESVLERECVEYSESIGGAAGEASVVLVEADVKNLLFRERLRIRIHFSNLLLLMLSLF
jgi:hypothetical protein